MLVVPPAHGVISLKDDALDNARKPCLVFTMADIYEGKVVYLHDNSDTSSDSFTFVVSDQTNDGFFVERDSKLFRTTDAVVCLRAEISFWMHV